MHIANSDRTLCNLSGNHLQMPYESVVHEDRLPQCHSAQLNISLYANVFNVTTLLQSGPFQAVHHCLTTQSKHILSYKVCTYRFQTTQHCPACAFRGSTEVLLFSLHNSENRVRVDSIESMLLLTFIRGVTRHLSDKTRD